MTDYRQQLQRLLKDLFQFDSADLDFGIYAIMNQKRAQIEQFIEHDLVDAVQDGLQILSQQGQAEAQLVFEQAKQQVMQALGTRALEGELLKEQYHDSPLGEKYLAAQKSLVGAQLSAELEAQIFNDLYQFFARYYQDGDFISQRRYGRSNKYAVPYNGEEVYLHWANFDQYYVKSGAYFTNYSFTVPRAIGLENGASVQVKISKVDVERDNVKGDKRFFIYTADQQLTWEETTQTLTIPMEYRPLTDAEAKQAGTRDQQKKLIEQAYAAILAQLPNNALKGVLTQSDPQQNSEQDRLSYHLNRYAAANTRDFFVHKDLGSFLRRELDYYLKSEVIQLDDINLEDNLSLRRAAARSKTIRSIADKIIAFLDQIESFQRRLFLKRKFIVQSDYSLTLDKIPEDMRASFYPEILANAKQLAEWQALYDLTVASEDDLAAHPHLMLDTAYFDGEFKVSLLATFEDIDDATDGLLVHGENFQALKLLLPRCQGQVKCVHIDPPYNTQTSGFLYKNSYQHSSWLSMMENRIEASIPLLSKDGSYICHIDENEYERLHLLLDSMSLPNAGTISWDKRNPMNSATGIATQHEYIVWRSLSEKPLIRPNKGLRSIIDAAAKIVVKNGAGTKEAQAEFSAWISGNKALSQGEKAYRFLDEKGQVYQSVSLRAPEPREDPKFHQPLIHPITGKSCPVPPNGFSRTPETLQSMIDRGEILFGVDETTQPRQKSLLTEDTTRQISSVIQEGKKGKADLSRLGLDFPYSHPVELYQDLIGTVAQEDHDIVLDYFAGSGTSAHAVMNLNAEDTRSRKYILVEMGEQFDSVLKPRIQKVAYSSDWQDGKPVVEPGKQRQQQLFSSGQSHMFQYIRLESYDDCYHNIRFKDVGAQQQLLSLMPDYFLAYLLEYETTGSPTLLDIQQLDRPFDYMLNVSGSGGVLEPRRVDLVATFSFLLGLSVQTLRTFEWGDSLYVRVTGTNPEGKKICVIWRTVPAEEHLDAEAQWVQETVLVNVGYDKLYINGESTLPDALLIEEEFKRRMFEGVQ